ncbi:hypothetical protein HDZ31DRAFT_64826 [Schizophyllum fasciatum]
MYNLQRKIRCRDDKIERLEATISSMEIDAAVSAKQHAAQLREALHASGQLWWELQKTREGISAQQRETERIRQLLRKWDQELTVKLKELFDVKKERCALVT